MRPERARRASSNDICTRAHSPEPPSPAENVK